MPVLEQSQGTTITGGNFVDASVSNVTNAYVLDSKKGSGIELLLKSALPQAIHNSSARDPPKCHPGTREEYIRDITGWGSGEWKTKRARALWMRGPAGVGKSAVAQTCVEGIEESGRLGATFFFFRPNGWNDPAKFIPTIAYQLATRYPAYRDLVDAIVLRDFLVLDTAIDVQFRELLVKPLHQLRAEGHDVGTDAVIIVDGLDECKTRTAQDVIVELVTTSVHNQTTPFLWAFFSRPEPNITAAFSSEHAKEVSLQLILPVSHDADSDIEAYLRYGFKKILANCGRSPDTPWPSVTDIRQLVDQSSGLFVYAATAIRYIGEDTGIGHEAQLQVVLELGRKNVGSNGNPLSKLDQFYTLIMEQIPKAVLANTLSLLSFNRYPVGERRILYICSVLGLSLSAFYTATSNLHSVLDITKSESGMPYVFSFYHASFTDFLDDPTRSGPEFCVTTRDIRQRCLRSTANTLYHISISDADILPWPDSSIDVASACAFAVYYLFVSVAHSDVLGEDILQQFSQLNWSKWPEKQSLSADPFSIHPWFVNQVTVKIPRRWRSKIIRSFRIGLLDVVRQTLSNVKRGELHFGLWKGYIVGRGNSKALLVPNHLGYYELKPYPGRG